MTNIKMFFLATILCLSGMAFAALRPHTGMVNDANSQNVGAVYPEVNYGGKVTLLLMDKHHPQCMQLYAHSPSTFSDSVIIMS